MLAVWLLGPSFSGAAAGAWDSNCAAAAVSVPGRAALLIRGGRGAAFQRQVVIW